MRLDTRLDTRNIFNNRDREALQQITWKEFAIPSLEIIKKV